MKYVLVRYTNLFDKRQRYVKRMETKLEYLLDSGTTLNMLEIQKYWNKTFQKDGHLHSKIHWLTLNLVSTAVLGTIFLAFA